ncbi:MAG TPA: glycosyltransferase family 39 protein [Candidatus Polarisedimenticolaceae bacterium]|nr:glycosyltransferase family 39 protein [Candidatus Polarisedimenticolaceae bacterium]
MAFRSERLGALAAFLVAGTVLFAGLGAVPLMQPDEGRNAEVAREMAASGSWLVPTLEGNPYLDKPAAYFAAVAVSLEALGTNEWGARMPSALFGLAILACLYAFARRFYDGATAAFVVISVATMPLFIAFSRIVIMDIALALCTSVAILAAFVAEAGATPDRRWHRVSAAAVGAGMLVKGPVGALVPGLVLIAFFWTSGRPRALRRVFSPLNFVIVLGLFLPWFFALVHAHPEFFHYGVVEESLNRFFTKTFNRGQPFWFFGPVFIATTMPWTILMAPLTVLAWRERKRLQPPDRLFILWTIVVLVFFSLSRTKQPGYILSGVIAAGVLVGRGLGAARASRAILGAALALAVVTLLGALALTLVARRGFGEKQAWLDLVWPQLVCALLVMALLGLLAWRSRRPGYAAASFATLQIALFTVAFPGARAYASTRSVKSLAEALAPLPRTTEIAAFESYPAGLSFYLGRTLTLVDDDAAALRSNFVTYWLKRQTTPPPALVSSSARGAWLAARTGDLVVVAPDAERDRLAGWLGDRAPVHRIAAGWSGAFRPAGGR